MKRETIKCKVCGAEIIPIKYLGKKHAVNAETKIGFIFIQDEYGHDIGVEMVTIHESHDATCPKAIAAIAQSRGASPCPE